MIVSKRRLAPIAGALAALAAGALIGYAAFGIHGIDVVSALNRDAAFVSTDSFATEIAHLFGKPGVFPVDHDLLKGGLVIVVLYLLWRTWRGYDWVAASGWTLLAISVTSTWLLAWYILWPLPLAVIAATGACWSRRSRAGAVRRPPDHAAAGAGVMSAPALAGRHLRAAAAAAAPARSGDRGRRAHAPDRDDAAGARRPAAGDRDDQRRRAPDARQPPPDRRPAARGAPTPATTTRT